MCGLSNVIYWLDAHGYPQEESAGERDLPAGEVDEPDPDGRRVALLREALAGGSSRQLQTVQDERCRSHPAPQLHPQIGPSGEMADAADSKSAVAQPRVGSSPTSGTTCNT